MKLPLRFFYLIGAGDYGKQIYSFCKKNKILSTVKFVDDKFNLNINNFLQIKKKVHFNITISNPDIRNNVYLRSLKANLIYKSLIFSNDNIYSTKIGEGCIIEPNTLISNDVSIGIGNFIFFGSAIAHNVDIGDFCNIGCNVVISGNVKLGNKIVVGANSFISNNLNICNNVVIGPGSVVLKNINKPGIYQGNSIIKLF
jgi:UDP-3-O-[3-hydroxymyristoyl] glucosamine N-acyltransferase